MQTNLHSLHRRLDRLGNDGGLSIADALDKARTKHEARQHAWTEAGHPGAPPREPMRQLAQDASRASREMWRKIAQGTARVIHGTPACPFATLQEAYALDDDALLAAINSHPFYAGWPEYDNKP
jgi:hypothetical protein